jgi:hypothetical protein
MLAAFGRFLLRFIIIPIGMFAAALTAVLVVSLAHWQNSLSMIDRDVAESLSIVVTLVNSGLVLTFWAFALLWPAAVGILLSEVFAIRAWMYHALNGALSMWVGWYIGKEFRRDYPLLQEFYDQPLVVVAAGIAAGFAYWAVAGWSAGFWKPVFQTAPPARPVAPATPR